MRRVVCAALKMGDDIVLGARHFDKLMHRQIDYLDPFGLDDASSAIQGFIDQLGVFMTREEAFEVASAAGQIIRRVGGDDGKLFSENLY
jgi:hypothetical protein